MNIPFIKDVELRYYHKGVYQFQLKEDGVPVTEDLNTQSIKFHVRGAGSFTPVVKDIVQEGWIINNVLKIIKVEIDPAILNMPFPDGNPGEYRGRIEWVDRKLFLVNFNIRIIPQLLWSL